MSRRGHARGQRFVKADFYELDWHYEECADGKTSAQSNAVTSKLLTTRWMVRGDFIKTRVLPVGQSDSAVMALVDRLELTRTHKLSRVCVCVCV